MPALKIWRVPVSVSMTALVFNTTHDIISLLFYRAVKTLYHAGLVVEPSGAAAFAALQANKIPNLSPESNVVVLVTGGNVTPEELCDLIS